VAGALVSRSAATGAVDPLAGLPRVVLWAWERPENLGFVDPREVGVAFLARTLTLRDGRVVSRPRLQPLTVPPATRLVAVVRIETAGGGATPLSDQQRAGVVSEVATLATDPRLLAIQIDFDARRSQRAFYRALLADLRRAVPPPTVLSITALASWCLGDPWLDAAAVDEAVPMLFRMGPDAERVRRHLAAGGDFAPAVSRLSLGVATDEPLPDLPRGRRLYVFHPRAWTRPAVEAVIQEARRWE
jgi:hypothetical protein